MTTGLVSKFQRNTYNGTTYRCANCGKRTRDTGYGEAGLDLCKKCYCEGGLENEHDDGGHADGKMHMDDKYQCPTCVKEGRTQ